MSNRLIIIGAGGHAKVVYETLIAEGKYEVVGFVDANLSVGTIVINGLKILFTQSELQKTITVADFFIVAIGKNEIRAKLYSEMIKYLKPAIVIHPKSYISDSAIINNGTVCLANSTINTLSEIGENTIVNCGVVIDHETKIGNHVHLSIGCNIGSNSIVNDFTTVKIGESIPSFSKINLQ
ncbi:MAG: hypothetical protein RJA07_2557 [Bacteroidota bacterium]|jgi:sugar O-acyltransferase (sialic acid O-acetyltransferase NeuD family)